MTKAQTKTILAAAPETWIKILVPAMLMAIVGALAWSFRVEGRLTHVVTDTELRTAIEKHSDTVHPLAASLEAFRDLRKRIELVERTQSSFQTTLRNIEKGIDEIKRDIRLISRRRRRVTNPGR